MEAVGSDEAEEASAQENINEAAEEGFAAELEYVGEDSERIEPDPDSDYNFEDSNADGQ